MSAAIVHLKVAAPTEKESERVLAECVALLKRNYSKPQDQEREQVLSVGVGQLSIKESMVLIGVNP